MNQNIHQKEIISIPSSSVFSTAVIKNTFPNFSPNYLKQQLASKEIQSAIPVYLQDSPYSGLPEE